MMLMIIVTDEAGVFTRERSAGLYRLSAYYLAVMTTEIPVTFMLTTLFVAVVYFMVNLTPATFNFIAHWMILELSTFTAQVNCSHQTVLIFLVIIDVNVFCYVILYFSFICSRNVTASKLL